ncbi:hypothetical protein [Konateibacter massiliensis]|uniref:hypothetical protein n=1 Tax=Konateibacter massiliensis TaxID=2002841 RepID=UPI000C146A56|nr:hypothetical protein [Konateibacter massiliensis]
MRLSKINENDLLENKELREQMANKVEVLEKVKELLLIPNTDKATIRQVAEYYEVGEEAIKSITKRNRDELEEDGTVNYSGNQTKDFLVGFNLNLTNGKGYFETEGIKFAYKSNTLLPRRAILRVGMLLQDSTIAKEVRTQLLNIEEKTSNETKTQDINEEQALALALGMAQVSGDITAITIATGNLIAFKNRHIEKLEQSNKALANGILEWEDRSRINFAVRKMAAFANIPVGQAWNELYKQIKNKFHIDLQSRGMKPWIQHINEKEWQCVIKSFTALCKYYEIDSNEMFHDLKIE